MNNLRQPLSFLGARNSKGGGNGDRGRALLPAGQTRRFRAGPASLGVDASRTIP